MTFDGSHRSFNPDATYVLDWRGNQYVLYEKLGVECEMPDCTADAVRLTCPRHPDRPNKTHHHGGIHDVTHALWYFCREHGEEAQQRYDTTNPRTNP